MEVGVIAQVPSPGLQNPDHTNLATHKAGIVSQLLQGCGGVAKEQIVDELLVASSDSSERGRQGEGDHEVRDWQEKRLLLFQPLLGSIMLAAGTVAISAGVIAIDGLIACLTPIEMSTQVFGAAGFDRRHCLPMTRGHALPILGSIGGSILTEDVGEVYHVRSAIN
jgi:hypothetical protein